MKTGELWEDRKMNILTPQLTDQFKEQLAGYIVGLCISKLARK
jgi:hypothetical protein